MSAVERKHSNSKFSVNSSSSSNSSNSGLKICYIKSDADGTLGIHLSRMPHDPYSWISGVVGGSNAEKSGINVGDCVLEVNGEDMLGLRISEVAEKIRGKWSISQNEKDVNLLLWNSGVDNNINNTQPLKKYATCLQKIAQLIECPVCLEISSPPTLQCVNGHIICKSCRLRTSRCPLCRVQLHRGRCLVADKLFMYLASCNTDESFPQQNLASLNKILNRSDAAFGPFKEHHRSFFIKDVLNFQPKYHCPTGNPCSPTKNRSSLLIHLQQIHQLPITQYYGKYGETITIKFNEKSISSIILSETEELNQFFVVKFRTLDNFKNGYYFLWADIKSSDRYEAYLSNNSSNLKWKGNVNSLFMSYQEIVKNKKYLILNYDLDCLNVKINLK